MGGWNCPFLRIDIYLCNHYHYLGLSILLCPFLLLHTRIEEAAIVQRWMARGQ